MIRTERLPDGTLDVVAEVTVGIGSRMVRVPLGSSAGEVDPGGLRNTPVVVLTEEGLQPVVRTGAQRAGQASVTSVRAGSDSTLGAALLDAARAAEVLVIVTTVDVAGDALVVARALGGRPFPVIPLDDPAAGRAMLRGCWVDLDVAIPSVDGGLRDRVRRVAEDLGLFTAHHVVEVDPRPSLAGAASRDVTGSTLHELVAGATGVLAGRVAAGNRAWR